MLFQLVGRVNEDRHELIWLRWKYGDAALGILHRRARNRKLSRRNRRHWRRLYCRLLLDRIFGGEQAQ